MSTRILLYLFKNVVFKYHQQLYINWLPHVSDISLHFINTVHVYNKVEKTNLSNRLD